MLLWAWNEIMHTKGLACYTCSINVTIDDNDIAVEHRPGSVCMTLLPLASASRRSLLVSIPQWSEGAESAESVHEGQEEEATWTSSSIAISPVEMSHRIIILSSSQTTPPSTLLYPQPGQHLLHNKSHKCGDFVHYILIICSDTEQKTSCGFYHD